MWQITLISTSRQQQVQRAVGGKARRLRNSYSPKDDERLNNVAHACTLIQRGFDSNGWDLVGTYLKTSARIPGHFAPRRTQSRFPTLPLL